MLRIPGTSSCFHKIENEKQPVTRYAESTAYLYVIEHNRKEKRAHRKHRRHDQERFVSGTKNHNASPPLEIVSQCNGLQSELALRLAHPLTPRTSAS
jgi:hypothetical protein